MIEKAMNEYNGPTIPGFYIVDLFAIYSDQFPLSKFLDSLLIGTGFFRSYLGKDNDD
jgi:hypothetical protein